MRYYETERLILRSLHKDEASIYRDYLVENKSFWQVWEPVRNDDFYSIESIEERLDDIDEQNTTKHPLAVRLYLFKREENTLIGEIGLSNIVYGAFLSSFLSYKLSKNEINKGYMTEALRYVIDIAFNELKLHRLEANIMPKNLRSTRLVEKLGFVCEGKSQKYLKINGKWEDHNHWVRLNTSL